MRSAGASDQRAARGQMVADEAPAFDAIGRAVVYFALRLAGEMGQLRSADGVPLPAREVGEVFGIADREMGEAVSQIQGRCASVRARPPRASTAPPADSARPAAQAAKQASLMTARQVAELLGRGMTFVRVGTRNGTIPHVKIGARGVRYERRMLDQWIGRRRVGKGFTTEGGRT